MRTTFTMLLALATVSGSAWALEASVGGGPQAAQSAVSSINSKLDSSVAALQAQITGFTYCSSIRKFFAPNDPKKDANGCVGVGDYDLNMSSASNVNLANGRVNGTNTASNDWSGMFYGPSNYGGVYGNAGAYGVYGVATGNGYGVVGVATANSGGVGVDGTGGTYGVRGNGGSFGVYGTATGANAYGLLGWAAESGGIGVRAYGKSMGIYATSTDSWAGDFGGANGVYASATGGGYGVLGSSDSGYGVYGQSANAYGVYGYSSGNLAVYGNAPTNWGGYFKGKYGVYAESTGTWAGEFYGYGSDTGGVYIGNNYNNARLCLNGDCRTAWPGASRFGGAYLYNEGGWCTTANPQTGGCSCPSGYSGYLNSIGFSHNDGYICQN